jgi:hypothetical protein
MAFANVDIGNAPADGTGDPLRTAFSKINQNFANIATGLIPINAPVRTVAGRIGNVTLTSNDIIGGISRANVQAMVNAANTASRAYTDQAIQNIVNDAPALLDTLGEIAANLSTGSSVSTAILNSITNINANVTAANLTISSLVSNAAGQQNSINAIGTNLDVATTNITTLFSNAAGQSEAIVSLQSNAAIQAAILDLLTGNAVSQAQTLDFLTGNASIQSLELQTLVTNAAAQQDSLTTLTANAAAQTQELMSLLSNAASQTTAIDNINQELSLIANTSAATDANIGTLRLDLNQLSSNVDVVIGDVSTLTSNLSLVSGGLSSLNQTVGVIDANLGVQVNELSSINANVTAANLAITVLQNAGYITANTANVVSVNGQTGVVTLNIPAPYTDGNVAVYLSTYPGALNPSSVNSSGDVSVGGVLDVGSITERFTANAAPGTVTDLVWNQSGIYYLSNLTGNITANLQNFSAPSGTISSVTLWIIQGATPYVPTAININNASQTIYWQAGTTAPGGTANKQDLVSFTILNNSGTYNVLGQLSSFG